MVHHIYISASLVVVRDTLTNIYSGSIDKNKVIKFYTSHPPTTTLLFFLNMKLAMNRISLQEKRAIVVGAKIAAICRLLRRVFGLPLYMRSIVAFYMLAVIALVFCGVLQRRANDPPQ